MGVRYGGIGAQFGVKNNDSKYYGSLGLFGASLGLQKTFNLHKNISYGLSIGMLGGIFFEENYALLSANYHAKGFKNKGWTIGVGVGITKDVAPRTDPSYHNSGSDIFYSFDIGYSF